jgi:hypothetical protein
MAGPWPRTRQEPGGSRLSTRRAPLCPDGSRQLAGPRWMARWVFLSACRSDLPVQPPIVLILSEAGGTMETCIPGRAERAREGERLRSFRTGLERLRRFRTSLYRSMTGWADAASELCDAASCAPAPVACTRRWPAGRLTPARCATCWPTTAHAPGRWCLPLVQGAPTAGAHTWRHLPERTARCRPQGVAQCRFGRRQWSVPVEAEEG